jgi:integrase
MARTPAAGPVYRLHRPSGRAVCTVRLPNGTRKDLYLGPYDTAAARAEYGRVAAVVAANGGVYPAGTPDLTVNEALARYGKFVAGYYRDPNGRPTGSADDIRITLGYLRRLFGPTPLAEFNIPQHKAVRAGMIEDGRVRTQVNKRCSQVRQFVKWCVEEQLVPPSVLDGLRAVRPLAPGRSGVKEGTPVGPADPAAVEKALEFMPPVVLAVVRLLRLTGARPSEILTLRPCDLDRSSGTWVYRPARHKSSWRLKERAIYFGPDARAVLSPWLLGCASDQFVFSPKRSEARRNRDRSSARITPLYPSHQARNEKKRVGTNRKRPPADVYDAKALAKAVRRACRRAQVPSFSPYQLRHLKAVELRERYGLEVVRAVLGHSFKAMSDHYSQAADAVLASRAAAEVG